jgi:pyruvate formate lyase activating enzyme
MSDDGKEKIISVCPVCPHHCRLAEGALGRCRARTNRNGNVVSVNYGKVTSIALDPIEKKPLAFYLPGSKVLSVGSFGCNLSCPFCQNHDIAQAGEKDIPELYTVTPEKILSIALDEVASGNIGVAYTYNEALVGYEFVRDTAKLVHENGLKNVLVTNGCCELPVLEKILPYIDAMNIDLKCFSEKTYREVLGGDLKMTKTFISESARKAHVEVTCLIVPGMNDTEEEMRALSSWIASLEDEKGNTIGDTIPLHISRFFPRFHMTDRSATDVDVVYSLAEIAREKLKYVYTGNC